MSIKRDIEDLAGNVLITVKNAAGDEIIADKEEYQDMLDADNISFPAGHNSGAMTLDECFPGYAEDML